MLSDKYKYEHTAFEKPVHSWKECFHLKSEAVFGDKNNDRFQTPMWDGRSHYWVKMDFNYFFRNDFHANFKAILCALDFSTSVVLQVSEFYDVSLKFNCHRNWKHWWSPVTQVFIGHEMSQHPGIKINFKDVFVTFFLGGADLFLLVLSDDRQGREINANLEKVATVGLLNNLKVHVHVSV